MPVNPTYPGVYLEELSSNAFAITGVATAITAFVGRATMGPVDSPVSCFSFADYVRAFGPRQAHLPMGYAVADFFQNGGGEALIVRVRGTGAADHDEDAPTPPADADADADTDADAGTAPAAASTPAGGAAQTAAANAKPPATTGGANSPAAPASTGDPAYGKASLGGIDFVAANPGAWSDLLSVTLDKALVTDRAVEARIPGATAQNTFNLTLTYAASDGATTVETFPMVTTADTPRRVDRVLKSESSLATAAPPATSGSAVVVENPKKPPTATFSAGQTGGALKAADLVGDPQQASRKGLYALDRVDLFNILCIPFDEDTEAALGADLQTLHAAAATYCQQRRAIYVVDAPNDWTVKARAGQLDKIEDPGKDLGITDAPSQRATAVYFPRILRSDAEQGGQLVAASAVGMIAGQMARNDDTRGVWKAPAGVAAALGGVQGLEFNLSDGEQGQLNPLGVNCLRNFRVLGPLVWGARTLRGADAMADDYKYLPVRRLTNYIEESLLRGLRPAVFEPNDEALWSQIRLTVGAFMNELSRQGAFYSYQIACDAKTTTQYHIDRGVCVVQVAFAPVKPAEFIVLQIQQQAGTAAA